MTEKLLENRTGKPELLKRALKAAYGPARAGHLLSGRRVLAIPPIPPPGRTAVHPAGREARTAYRVVQDRGTTALVELTPGTGRMHQLRVHLAHLGTPLLGDPLYDASRTPETPAPLLHAARLAWADPPGAPGGRGRGRPRCPGRGELGHDPAVTDSALPLDVLGPVFELSAERPLAVFDLETTGTDRLSDRVVEVAVVRFGKGRRGRDLRPPREPRRQDPARVHARARHLGRGRRGLSDVCGARAGARRVPRRLRPRGLQHPPVRRPGPPPRVRAREGPVLDGRAARRRHADDLLPARAARPRRRRALLRGARARRGPRGARGRRRLGRGPRRAAPALRRTSRATSRRSTSSRGRPRAATSTPTSASSGATARSCSRSASTAGRGSRTSRRRTRRTSTGSSTGTSRTRPSASRATRSAASSRAGIERSPSPPAASCGGAAGSARLALLTLGWVAPRARDPRRSPARPPGLAVRRRREWRSSTSRAAGCSGRCGAFARRNPRFERAWLKARAWLRERRRKTARASPAA